MIEEDQKPDLTLKYSDEESYKEVRFDYQCRDRDVTTLLVHALNWFPDSDGNENTVEGQHVLSECRVDLVHSSNGKIWHSRKVLLDLSVCHLPDWGNIDLFLTRSKIYVHGTIGDMVFKAFEFDFNGKYITSYTANAPDNAFPVLNSFRGTMHYWSQTTDSDSEFQSHRLLKFKNGKVEILAVWDDDTLNRDFFGPHKSEKSYFYHDGIVTRLGHLLSHSRIFRDNGLCEFRFVDLKTKQTFIEFEVPDNPMSNGKFDLNSNGREFSILYYDDQLLLKISRTKILRTDQMTLKQYAKLAVLTSFSEEYLIQQNLPNTLFEYLGIDK